MSSDALPEHLGRVEVEVAKVDVVVDRRGQQVVRGGDRVEVAGELEVDRVRRLDPARAAAGRSSLAAEDRPHRRLPQRQGHALADSPQPLGQPDRRGRLALSRRSGRDRRDQDQLARLTARSRDRSRAGSWPCRGRRARGVPRRCPDLAPPPRSASWRLRQCVSCDFGSSARRFVLDRPAPWDRPTDRNGSRSSGSTARSRESRGTLITQARSTRRQQRPARDQQMFNQS